MIPTLIHFFKKLAHVFQKPKIRVRRIVGAREIWGTVEKEQHHPSAFDPEQVFCYWTVKWDDSPVWVTYMASKFQWIRGRHTLFATR